MTQVYLPRDLDELWDLLRREPEAELYAGGTDLLVKTRSGLVNPSCLVCLERIDALRGVIDEGDSVFVGATTTHSQLLENPLIATDFPVLTKALGMLGSPPIRHMATIGGNIVTASPAGDSLPPLTVLGADVQVASATRSRRIPLSLFIQGPGVVDLRKGEVMMGVWIQKQRAFNVHHYEKIGRRKSQVCGVASMAALLEVSQSGAIEQVRLAWGCVGPTVVVSAQIDQTLAGMPLTVETLKTVAPLVEQTVSPIDDVRASAQYRRWLAGALVLRLSEYGYRGRENRA